MRRKAFDTILTSSGLVLAIVLMVAAGLALFGTVFAKNNVRDQLAQQKITFPAKGDAALAPPAIGKYLNRYAGKQLTTGPEAKAYADHFIAVHLQGISGGKTYAELSTASQADPKNAQLAATVQTVFRGQTLRGLLLEAYGFSVMAEIASIAYWCLAGLAAMTLCLTVLGFFHLRKVNADSQFL